MKSAEMLNSLLSDLASGTVIKASDWPADAAVLPVDLGLELDSEGSLYWSDPPQTLDDDLLLRSLADLDVTYFPVIDSTNSQLVTQGASTSIAGRLYLAEFQYGGRGRRGRTWMSPFARNLSMSLGVSTQRSLPELGGLSLVVGLALADAFESLQIRGLQLKWPNDLLVSANKLTGVLVELVQRGQQVECVIGIGVNVDITEAERTLIDQPVADLRQLGVTVSRTELVITLIRRLQEYLTLFEHQGFSPFVTAFNDLHTYHGETCTLIQGEQTTVGVVRGVGDRGELLLQTDEGVQQFHGGEVSLRPGER